MAPLIWNSWLRPWRQVAAWRGGTGGERQCKQPVAEGVELECLLGQLGAREQANARGGQRHETCSPEARAGGSAARGVQAAFFYFYIFQNRFLQKYIFGFIIYRFKPLPPGYGAAPAALLPGGRDLNINKIYF